MENNGRETRTHTHTHTHTHTCFYEFFNTNCVSFVRTGSWWPNQISNSEPVETQTNTYTHTHTHTHTHVHTAQSFVLYSSTGTLSRCEIRHVVRLLTRRASTSVSLGHGPRTAGRSSPRLKVPILASSVNVFPRARRTALVACVVAFTPQMGLAVHSLTGC